MNQNSPLQVGIVGASAKSGWAKVSHVVAFTPPVEPAVFGAPATAINVGEVYASLIRDMNAGTYDTPGFQHALHNARLVEAVRRAAERGERQRVTS
jgi:hypothetical protein